MPRVRLVLDFPDLSDLPPGHPDSVAARLLAEAARGALAGKPVAVTIPVGGATFTSELVGVEEYGPTEGLAITAASVNDLDSAWEEVEQLARDVLSAEYDDFPQGVTLGALSRVLSSIESVFLTDQGRFATTEERRRVVRGMNVWERNAPTT